MLTSVVPELEVLVTVVLLEVLVDEEVELAALFSAVAELCALQVRRGVALHEGIGGVVVAQALTGSAQARLRLDHGEAGRTAFGAGRSAERGDARR